MAKAIYRGITFEEVTTQAFEQLVLPLKNKLFRFAMSYLNNEDDAKDVVQEVLIKTWEDIKDIASIRNIEAWCMTLVKNKSLDKLKYRGRNHLQIGDQHQLRIVDADPLQQTITNEKLNWVKKVIQALPIQQKEAITLRDIEGYSYQEIADIMGIEMSNVKVLIHRARMQMRNRMKEIQGHGL